MTSVLISHNPFRTETEILIDEQPITDTSRLFKYLHTPMQDWVGDFLPSLIADCNDDELEITFRGLPYHYEDLKAELKEFLRENIDYDIKLSFNVCVDQTARLNTLNDILYEIKTQDMVEELKEPDFISSFSPTNNHLVVLILGGSSSQQAVLVNGLFGSGIYNPQSSIQKILLDTNHQFTPSSAPPPSLESLEDLIRSDDKPIVICLLDNQLKRSKAGFLDIIAAQHRIRGKQNKQRFLFVAETPALAKRTLHSEFSIKHASVYAFDEAALMQKKIEKYFNEVSLVNYLTSQCDKTVLHLDGLERKLSAMAEETRTFEDIDALESRALTLLGNIELVVSSPDTSSYIDRFITQLCTEFNSLKSHLPVSKKSAFQSNTAPKGRIETEPMTNAIINYIQELSKKFNEEFKIIETNVHPSAHVNIPQGLLTVLKDLNCPVAGTLLQELKEQLNTAIYPSLNKEKYISNIQRLIFKDKYNNNIGFLTAMFDLKISSLDDCTSIGTYKAPYKAVLSDSGNRAFRQYQFYPGLIVHCCKCLSAETYSSNELVKKAQDRFASDIRQIKPVFESFLQELSSLHYSQRERMYDQALAKIDKAIREQAQHLRDTAGISEDDLARLQYIQSMKARITQLTCLEAEGT